MKKILFSSVLIVLLQSCSKPPKCGDAKVTENAITEFKSQIREKLLQEYYDENINTRDVHAYAYENNYSYDEVLENEKTKLNDKAELYVSNQLSDTKFKNKNIMENTKGLKM